MLVGQGLIRGERMSVRTTIFASADCPPRCYHCKTVFQGASGWDMRKGRRTYLQQVCDDEIMPLLICPICIIKERHIFAQQRCNGEQGNRVLALHPRQELEEVGAVPACTLARIGDPEPSVRVLSDQVQSEVASDPPQRPSTAGILRSSR